MAKVKLNFRRLSVPEKISKAKEMVTALTGNPDFPNPSPALAIITAAINALEASYTTTQSLKSSLSASVADQSVKEDGLDQLVSQMASYVEAVAGANEALIKSAGMDTKALASAPTLPENPSGLEANGGPHEGKLDLSWNSVSGARSYIIQQCADPPTAQGWAHVGTSTKVKKTVDGLNSGTRYWFRVAAVGASGQSGWSDPCTKIAP
jgi:hypothetical protein